MVFGPGLFGSVLSGDDEGPDQRLDRGQNENTIIGKLIPPATGLKRHRMIEIGRSDEVAASAYLRPG